MRYRVIAGGHRDVNGRDYVTGDIVTTSRPLDKIFGTSKFQKIEAPEKNLKINKKIVKKTQNTEEPSGNDVTENYPLAFANDFKVYQKGRWNYVYSADDLSAPLNDKGLTKDKVVSFVHENL